MARKKWTGMILPVILIVAIIGVVYGFYSGMIKLPTAVQGTQLPSGNTAQTSCPQDPSISYIGFDTYNKGTTVQGTDRIKVNGGVPKTTYATGKYGESIQYWKQNQSTTGYACVPVTEVLSCDNKQIESPCFRNTSVTLTAFDKDQNALLTVSSQNGTNFTMSASTPKVFYFRLTGVKDQQGFPFGGVMTVEVPNDFASVVVNHPNVKQGTGVYHDTFSPSSVTQTFLQFNFDSALEGADGTLKEIPITLTAGSSDPTEDTIRICLDSANYYVDKNGNFALDVEKYNNQDTTKVSMNRICEEWKIA